ncbi:hypothetical protein GIS00_26625 [Nakamurella sp. YIM 132087]|uniref:Uncharacterized protein n=1 Tax=Nakamurella alba TaxID=2665158 RepID=A0A7K1FTQ1_9ACTN|nr:hypothetical protein [Nakamurella alba]MTD17508.1 hypothetical protein [Nakamurella alba]
MNPEEMNADLRRIEQDEVPRTADELRAHLTRLDELAGEVELLPAGGMQSTLASITQLRLRVTGRHNYALLNGTG